MKQRYSNITFSSTIADYYDIPTVEENFRQLSKEWLPYEYLENNYGWKIAYQLKLLAGKVEVNIDGRSLTEIYNTPLGFQVESLVTHAYELLWGSAFSQSFNKLYEIDIEQTGIRFQLIRNGNVLYMTSNSHSLENIAFQIDPLQYLSAVSDYYSSTIKQLSLSHSTLASNDSFVKAIPFIQFIDGN